LSEKINISSLFTNSYPIIDVRSPAEYAKGHIPNAINMPMFSNEERAIVGTIYKQESQEAALLKGLDIVGGKMSDFIRKAKIIAPYKDLIIHCWRGGKRSSSISWLLGMAGMRVKILEGGYKAYRQYIRQQFQEKETSFVLLTGSTGSGKTKALHHLRSKGDQIIDLEGLANHKGSAFGGINEEQQPSTEQFENNLYEAFCQLDMSKRIWLESESRMIGNISIPETFWLKMVDAPMVHLHISKAARIQYLVQNYGEYPKEELASSFEKLKKRLAQHLAVALEALNNGDIATAAEIALDYYDKFYNKHLVKNKNRIFKTIDFEEMDFDKICEELLNTKLDVEI
jgi:tRNA 2-selenouridine synthase